MVLAGTLGGIITASSGPSFVSADNAKGERYAPVYFPGTADPQRAVAIDLRPGADYSGVDFRLRRVRTRRLRGIVIDGSTGRPANGASVWLAPRNTGASGNLGNGHADSNGEFSIDGVLPGSYFLIAFPASRSPGRWLGGRTAMEVGDADLERLSVVLMPSVEIAGQLVIEGRENTADEVHPVIALYSQTQNVPFLSQTLFASFSGNRARAFTIDNAVEGDYDVRLEALQPDQYVKSIRFGGVDVLNGGLHLDPRAAGRLEVILGVDAGGLEGAVVNGNHERVANVRVALVPDVARRERADLFKSVSTDDAGQFRIQGIAPGDYTVFGWEDIEDGVWRDPEFIRKFEGRGTLIHVDGVSKQSIELLLLTVS
jgi:hypothetical protein